MPITYAHSFLIHTSKKNDTPQPIIGVDIPKENKVFSMLSKLYGKADVECNTEIVFRRSDEGLQENACRNLMMSYVNNPIISNGCAIAERLQQVTTLRSGLVGLLFLAAGDEEKKRLMISRFPADQGIIAEERSKKLEIEFIERVFMKNANAYKCAIYAGPVIDGGFWSGLAIDKQTSQKEISNYWIGEFLNSDLATTGPAGTKRLALALRDAIKSTVDHDLRDELLAATKLMRNNDGMIVNADRICKNLSLSPDSIKAIKSQMQRNEMFYEQFKFDREEFDKHAKYRSVELDNGAVLTAEDEKFDEVFHSSLASENKIMYSTTGSIIQKRLRSKQA